MFHYNRNASFLTFASPSTRFLVLGMMLEIVGVVVALFTRVLALIITELLPDVAQIRPVVFYLKLIHFTCISIGIISLFIALFLELIMTDAQRMGHLIRKRLFLYQYGNPLHLKDHERLPKVKCKKKSDGVFVVTISTSCCTTEEIESVATAISSGLNQRYRRYAITNANVDLAFNNVSFQIEDVLIDRSITIQDVRELCPKSPIHLLVDKEHNIDLTTSGSMLVAGKTRSGKTTAVISLLLQALQAGKDNYDSRIMVIDPKRAELSRLPHTVTLDEDGNASAILEAIQEFADMVTKRQQVLNDLSEQKGNAIHWWEADMHVSLLFIDEYVACRTMLPKKASKDNPDYSLATFDALLKKIVTMGASAGAYVIISIAEASVDESGGGLPAMLRSACSTKILFRPTIPEARLLWDTEKLKELNANRVYNAGDAWFSSTDGINDNISFVHFPNLAFDVYRKLGQLLSAYYDD